MSKASNPVKYLVGIFDSFGVSLNQTMRREIMYEIDHNGLVLWRSKYGFLRIIKDYTNTGFIYVEAPVVYATSIVQTFLHINHLGMCSEVIKDFEDFEFEGLELIHINKFWMWWLTKVMKVNPPTQAKEE
jgi:hypothetical protein